MIIINSLICCQIDELPLLHIETNIAFLPKTEQSSTSHQRHFTFNVPFLLAPFTVTIHYFKTSQPTKSQTAYTHRIERFTRYRIIETHCQKTVIKSYQYCSITCGRDGAIIVIPFSPVSINFGVSTTSDDKGSCKNQSRFMQGDRNINMLHSRCVPM